MLPALRGFESFSFYHPQVYTWGYLLSPLRGWLEGYDSNYTVALTSAGTGVPTAAGLITAGSCSGSQTIASA